MSFDIDQELADFRTGIGADFFITFDLRRSVMLVALKFVSARCDEHGERGCGFGFTQQLPANAAQS
jgi:hypothetical protein